MSKKKYEIDVHFTVGRVIRKLDRKLVFLICDSHMKRANINRISSYIQARIEEERYNHRTPVRNNQENYKNVIKRQ